MKHLVYMRTSKCTWLDLAIRSDKTNAGLLRYASVGLLACYQDFDDIIDSYRDRPATSRVDFTGPLLREFYSKPPTNLNEELKFRRRKHGLDECPYCGHPFPPKTLDHFLPKEDWPEYALFSNNLVPQCRDCMPVKGQRYYCADHGQALFLHPMYSAALSTVRFSIDVSLSGGEPIFKPEFNVLEDVSDQDVERVKLHLRSLQVKKRIVEYCDDQYRRWIRIVKSKGCNIRASFKTRLKERELDQYASNWSIAFYQGVLRNPDVVANLQSHAPHGAPRKSVKVRPLLMDD